MAKELPYFQFEPAEYLTKDISFCSLSAQGLFINICSYYWQRQCDLTKEQFLRRFNYESEFNELIKEGIIDLIDNKISIKFLDIQFNNATIKSRVNSENGAKGGRPKKPKQNPNESEFKPKQNPNESESKGIREDKIREDKIREDKTIPSIDEFVAYAVSLKPNVNTEQVKFKYNAWLVNDWKVNRKGKDVEIKNWKTTLSNTMQYFDEKQLNSNPFKITM